MSCLFEMPMNLVLFIRFLENTGRFRGQNFQKGKELILPAFNRFKKSQITQKAWEKSCSNEVFWLLRIDHEQKIMELSCNSLQIFLLVWLGGKDCKTHLIGHQTPNQCFPGLNLYTCWPTVQLDTYLNTGGGETAKPLEFIY